MAVAAINSIRKKKLPKAPKLTTGSKKSWDTFDKKKKEVEAHNKKIEAEKSRREKIKSR
jgi:hypothetical protein